MPRPPTQTDSRPNVKRSARFERRTDESLQRARALRKTMSPPECKVWVRIRNRQLGGLRFRRQHPIGDYAADFYCDEARLVVELDGDWHRDRRAEDAARDAFMRAQGLEIVRLSVSEFERHTDRVVDHILRVAMARVDEAGKER